jgi:hypothetical protein
VYRSLLLPLELACSLCRGVSPNSRLSLQL